MECFNSREAYQILFLSWFIANILMPGQNIVLQQTFSIAQG